MLKRNEVAAIRLYYDNPKHQKILEVFNNLDKSIYKTKSRLIEEALLFFIDYYGKEGYMTSGFEIENPYITKEEFEKYMESYKNEFNMIAHDQAFLILGQVMSGVSNTGNKMITNDIKSENDSISDDEDISDYTMSFMDFN